MNESIEQDAFLMTCHVIGTTNIFVRKFPSDEMVINRIVAIALNGFLIVPTILLNGVSAATIMKSSQLNSKPCYFIILLQSMTDVAVGIIGIPLFITFMLSGMGKISNCFAIIFFFKTTILLNTVSVTTLSALTLERYIAILHPYSYKTQVTKRRITLYVVSGMLMMCLVVILSFFIDKIIGRFVLAMVTLFFLFAAFAYTRIYLVVRKLSRPKNQIYDNDAGNISRLKTLLQKMKQAKSCVLVVLSYFVLCVVPVILTVPFSRTFSIFERGSFQIWPITCGIINSSVNSMIYFWTKTMMRKDAIRMLKSITGCL